jgi:hypothetical protein
MWEAWPVEKKRKEKTKTNRTLFMGPNIRLADLLEGVEEENWLKIQQIPGPSGLLKKKSFEGAK